MGIPTRFQDIQKSTSKREGWKHRSKQDCRQPLSPIFQFINQRIINLYERCLSGIRFLILNVGNS